MTPEQAAQLYHEQYGEAATAYLDADLQAAQEEYRNAQKMKTDAKGWFDRRKQVAEQKAALARAQQTYDNVKAIYDAYHSKYGNTEAKRQTEEKPWTKENRAQKVEENKVLTGDTAEAMIGSQAYNAITKIAKLMGVNLVWLKHADANGWYDKDSNTVYLALDAERAISMVFGHEMLHEMRAQNESAYEAMKAAAKALLGAKYKDVFDKTRKLYIEHKKEMLAEDYKKKGYRDDLIQYILDERETNGTLLSDGYIEEEIVADAVGGMINDFDLAKDIALRLDHPTLYAMKQAVDKVAGLFGKTNPYGKQARALGDIIYDAYNRTRNKEEYSAEELKAMDEKAEQSIKADEAKLKAEEEAKAKQNAEQQKTDEGKAEEGEQTEDKPTDIKPVGRNKFGNIYSQFRGKPKEAFDFLLKNKSGYLSGVFYRDEIGDIDLAYGDARTIHTGKGLAHIIKKHVDFYGDFDSVEDAINKITDVVQNGIVSSNNNGGYDILKDGYKVVVASDEAGKWVLSAFDSVTSKKEKLRNREKKGAATNQTPGLPNDGAGAVAPNLSTAKVDNSSDTSKENDEEVKQSLREEGEDGLKFSVRTKPDPKKTIKVYKLMRLEDDGKLYPLFVDGATPIELGTWYDADSPKLDTLKQLPSGVHLLDTKTGEVTSYEDFFAEHRDMFNHGRITKFPSAEAINWATEHGKRFMFIEDTKLKQHRFDGEYRRYWNIGINGTGVPSTFSMRPGWHAGSLPTMRQIGKGKGKDLRDDRFVWTEGEMAADVDYNEEASKNPDNDLPDKMPEDGYYLKATNANKAKSQADRVGWYVGGSFKANRIISDSEAHAVIDKWNEQHKDKPVKYDFERESGKVFNADTMQLEDPDGVKQSLREEKEDDTSSGVSSMIDAANKSDDGIRFNLRTEKDVQDKLRNYVASEVEKPGSISDWTATDIDGVLKETEWLINQIHTALNGNPRYDEWAQREPTVRRDWRDGEMHPIVTWARGNIEYKYDVSADLLCINNEALESTLAMPDMVEFMYLINKSSKKGYTADDYMRLYKTMRDLGINVPCKGCFDAAGRLKMLPSVSRKFVAEVNKVIDERNKNPEQFDEKLRSMNVSAKTVNGLPAKSKNKMEAIRVGVAGDNLTDHVSWTQLMSAEGQTKALSDWGGIFRAWQRTGAGRPKDKLLPEPYDGVLTDNTFTIIGAYGEKTPSFRDMEVNVSTGLRRNSHSEFRPILAIDEIQFVRDAFVKNLMVFKYMKEIDDVRLFGKMGIKYNMSFFPAFDAKGRAAGLDADGNYIASEESVGSREFIYHDENGKQHFDGMKGLQEAMKYVNKDVSLSSVVFSVPHLLKALTDVPTHKDKNGMWGSLIPFHASGATAGQLYEQGLGRVRAINTKHPFSVEAFEDYDKGVTNFEQVQDDRFGEGWEILEGKKAGTKVNPGHKLEFANGNHYYNSALGVHLFSSWYVFDKDIKPEHREGMMRGDADVKKEVKSYAGQGYSIDYNDKVREIGGKQPYKDAADYYIEALKGIGLIPRFDFDVSEDKFLEMCDVAGVDPNHPKLGWKGKGHSWSPIDSDAYYSVFCDYGMTDPETGEYSPHRPVGYIDEQGNRTFKLPDNAVDIIKDGVDRYTKMRDHEDSMHKQVMEEYVKRTVEDGKITQKQADEFLKKYESSSNDGIKQSLRESDGNTGEEDGIKFSLPGSHRSEEAERRNKATHRQDVLMSEFTTMSVEEAAELRKANERKFKEKTKELYDKVLKGKYNDVTLRQLDEFINSYTPYNEFGRRLSKRIPQDIERKVFQRERTNIIDALYTRISESAVRRAEGELAKARGRRTPEETRRAIKKKKQELLKQWAIATGHWHTDISDFTNDKEPFGGGGDSDVYMSKDGKHVIKVSRGKDKGRFTQDPDDIALFNFVFRGSRYNILGYGEINGKFVRFLEQPVVDFSANKEELPVDERVQYMDNLGFHPINKDKTAFSNGTIVASDIQKGNIIKDKDGNVRVIDADMRLHTKEEGGQYVIPPVENDLPKTEPKMSLRDTDKEYLEAVEQGDRQRAFKEAVDSRDDIKFSIRTKHGSAADFDHVDHSHMGEGEGAQAYGWGTYATEVDGIARGYADRSVMSRLKGDKKYQALYSDYSDAYYRYSAANSEAYQLKELIDQKRKEYQERVEEYTDEDYVAQGLKQDIDAYTEEYEPMRATADEAKEEMDEAEKGMEKYVKGKRHLYTFEIPDDNGKNYLDWDKVYSTNEAFDIVDRLLETAWEKEKSGDYDTAEMIRDSANNIAERAEEYNEKGRKMDGETLYYLVNSDAKTASGILNAAGFTGIRYPAEYRSGGRKDGAKNYVIFNEKDAQIVDHERFSLKKPKDIEQVNNTFNDELQALIDGKLKGNHVFKLGNPSDALLYAGFEDYPIELKASTLQVKSDSDYIHNHPFDLNNVRNLPKAIQQPIAVFDSEYENGRKVILTELKDDNGNNMLAIVALRTIGKRNAIQVNSVISLYGKNSSARIAKWFDSRNPQGLGLDKDLCLWADTKKAFQWLSNNASDVHSVGQSRKRIANVINKFQDAQFEEENSSDDTKNSLREGNESSEPLFSLRDSYDTKMSKWKARNGLADDAQPMEKPVRGANESIGDFMNRMAQYAKDQALWKTAPRPTGFSEALEQWKQDNGIPADQFRPSIPRKADYATNDEYRQARDQYKQEMEKWKGAPKASDYDLSVEFDKLSTQMRAVRAAMRMLGRSSTSSIPSLHAAH